MGEPNQHVLVIGAGITGLLIAQGLKKAGIRCTIFEAEPSAAHYRSREWGMSIQWALPLLQDCLSDDTYHRIHTAAVDPFYDPSDPGILPTFNGATGEHMKDIPLVLQDVGDPADPSTWTFQLQTTWKKREGEEATSLASHKKRAETFGEPFRSANLWIPEGTQIYDNRMSYWVPIPWDNRGGRIIIAGDAAHPMTFQRGQGMNHGIADVSKLTRCLGSAVAGDMSWQDAVTAYQMEMIDRAGEEVATSKMNTEMLHDWERMQDSPIMRKGGHPREAAVVK
ncbi:MAG: hypothetical protein Q9165_002083 [Trypethelium subeluteriae]